MLFEFILRTDEGISMKFGLQIHLMLFLQRVLQISPKVFLHSLLPEMQVGEFGRN